jgi:hypothetical protein
MFTAPDLISEPLYVITSIFNPIRYKSRWKHYERFAQHVKESGGILYTVEAAYGERAHALSANESHKGPIIQRAPTNPTTFEETRSVSPHKYIKVRTDQELWVKENLLNIGLAHLPPEAKYVAFVDADVQFARPNWVGETIHQLQHYKVVQMFSEAHDVGPHYNMIASHKSFAWCYNNGLEIPKAPASYYYGAKGSKGDPHMWHPGFAWAWRRDALDEVGRLIDYAVLGAADNHMARGLIGKIKDSYHPKITPGYKARLNEWQFQAEKNIRRNVGHVSGLLLHYWHGAKVDRKYYDRWEILVNNKYDPHKDVKLDWQGVLQLNDRGNTRSILLRDQIMQYFRQRNEDDIPTVDL